jgi:hypothetical protein
LEPLAFKAREDSVRIEDEIVDPISMEMDMGGLLFRRIGFPSSLSM